MRTVSVSIFQISEQLFRGRLDQVQALVLWRDVVQSAARVELLGEWRRRTLLGVPAG
jgi:hypothetical protein